MSMFLDFIENFKKYGLEFYKKYYSDYTGIVTNVEDPDKRGRIKVKIPAILGLDNELAVWAEPSDLKISGKGHGEFFVPYVGDFVTVSFEFGSLDKPIYRGGYFVKDALPADFKNSYNNVRGWVFRNGSKILVDETKDKDKIVVFNKDGSSIVIGGEKGKEFIKITHNSGANVTLNEKGEILAQAKQNKELVELKVGEVNIKSSGKINVTCDGDATVNAKGKVSISSGGDAQVSAKGKVDVKGTAQSSFGSAASATDVNGQIVKIAGGAVPVAKLGSQAIGIGNDGSPVMSTIIDGSPVVLVK